MKGNEKGTRCSICGQQVRPEDKMVEGKMKQGGIVRIHLHCWVEEQKERRTNYGERNKNPRADD